MEWMMALDYKALLSAKMENIMDMHVLFADIKIMKNNTSNRPQRIALPGLVLSSKGGYRSGS